MQEKPPEPTGKVLIFFTCFMKNCFMKDKGKRM